MKLTDRWRRPRIVLRNYSLGAITMRCLLSISLALSMALCPAVCRSHVAPHCAGGLGPCHQVKDTLAQACDAATHCCAATDCKDSATLANGEPVERPTLPLDRCCEDGNCLCGGALLAKLGVELHGLNELVLYVARPTSDAGMNSNQQFAAEHACASAFSNSGTSIGRALRLRIESLLI